MPGSSRLDEHYGSDPRGRIKPRRSRLWLLWIAIAALGLLLTGWAGRADVARFVRWLASDWRASTFAGTVVDAVTGRPVPRARVHVAGVGANPLRPGEWMRSIARDDVTSATGVFTLRTPRIGRTTIVFAAPGYRDTVIAPDGPAPLLVAMTPR